MHVHINCSYSAPRIMAMGTSSVAVAAGTLASVVAMLGPGQVAAEAECLDACCAIGT